MTWSIALPVRAKHRAGLAPTRRVHRVPTIECQQPKSVRRSSTVGRREAQHCLPLMIERKRALIDRHTDRLPRLGGHAQHARFSRRRRRRQRGDEQTLHALGREAGVDEVVLVLDAEVGSID